jgi:phosphohistidine phosphatase SixA
MAPIRFPLAILLLLALALPGRSWAAASGPELVAALQRGGYVLLMRHASSPRAPPAAGAADSGNPNRERQLDEAGRAAARAMGEALKSLRIPIVEIWSSPTYRALETVRLMGLPAPRTAPELGDGGQSMSAAGSDQASWLKRRIAAVPSGGDALLVTHAPNIAAALGSAAPEVADGEALVLRPDGQGGSALVGRIRIEDWPALARR